MESALRILPMMIVVKRAYALARERAPALKTPLGALAILFALRFMIQPTMTPGDMPSGGSLALAGLVGIIGTIGSIAFVVGTHRMVLQSETQTGLDYFRFDQRTLAYIGWSVLFGLAVGIATAIAGLFTALISFLGAILLAIVVVGSVVAGLRLSVFLPAVAIGDRDTRPITAWDKTRGNTLRLLGGAGLVTMPLGLIAAIVGAIFMRAGFIGKLIGAALTGPIQAAMVLLGAIFLSLSYDFLVRGNGPGQKVLTAP